MRSPRLGWQALKWNYLGNFMRSLSQFVIGILLARLLGPEPFGIIAIAWMMLGIGNLFADLGFGAALVQRERLSNLDLRFIFTCQMAFASLLTVSTLAAAPAIAAYFHKPDGAPVIQAMSLLFVFQCLGETSAAVLRRSLNFKALQQVAIVSYLAGYLCAGLPLAWYGAGVWSLVVAQLLQSLLNSVLLIRLTAVPLAPCLRRDAHDMLSFGLKVTAANLSSWGISNLDVFCIGRAFGVVNLGLYNRALNLMNAPMSVITAGFQGVLFAACSRAQSDRQQVKRIYLETNAGVAMLCLPLFATAAVVPDTLIQAVYGKAWQSSVPLVTPLALAVMVNALLAIKGPILMAGNRVGLELKNQLITLLLFVPALFLAVQVSLQAVAWAVFGTYVVRWLLLAIDTLRVTGATLAEYVRTFRDPVLVGVLVAAVAASTDAVLASLAPLARLVAVAAACGLALAGLLRLLGGRFLKQNLATLVAVERLSSPLRRFLNV
ncbi:lipopolysaccharide biosynthesis protein [Massilia horti]|uniref:lipopolysaccharide biosynthesis protein n=1 Tax=Massilia horti TaxID=2562153 RepID=UPI001430204A|nr:lipopolysaccharide biosynthesis protein [Massilia horti]